MENDPNQSRCNHKQKNIFWNYPKSRFLFTVHSFTSLYKNILLIGNANAIRTISPALIPLQ
jgi:hypothetical protein